MEFKTTSVHKININCYYAGSCDGPTTLINQGTPDRDFTMLTKPIIASLFDFIPTTIFRSIFRISSIFILIILFQFSFNIACAGLIRNT